MRTVDEHLTNLAGHPIVEPMASFAHLTPPPYTIEVIFLTIDPASKAHIIVLVNRTK
jgi:hypothetical protein